MPDNAPENDPREIWRSQPTEPSEMKLGNLLLRQKARELRSKNRRELFGTIAFGVLVSAMSIYGIIWSNNPVAQAAFAVAVAWALAGQYFLHRGMWLAPPPADAALVTGLEYCRREVEGRLRLVRNLLLWAVAPLILAIGAFIWTISPKGPTVKMAPFLALVAIWALSMIVIRVRQERELQREIEELDQIERESRA